MAKKVISKGRIGDSNRQMVKLIVPYRSLKTGSIAFRSEMVYQDQLQEFVAKYSL